MKERTYKREPRNLPELRAVVTECVRAATARECRRVIAEVLRRVEIEIESTGQKWGHSDQLSQFPGRGSNGDDKRWM